MREENQHLANTKEVEEMRDEGVMCFLTEIGSTEDSGGWKRDVPC